MTYVFGPVPSRRLGRSLGVDLVPFKTCTYDCVYCQLGRTTHRTLERREYVPLDDVVKAVAARLDSRPDYITLSGSGEPTLYSRLDKLIERIHSLTDVPVAVLTNGSLLCDAEVRRQLGTADLVIPSLDAGSESLFQAVNRPHPAVRFERMIDGLIAFRREVACQYWLEVFILAGYTAVPAEARAIAELARVIGPDRVQLNTVTRPPAEDFAVGVGRARMDQLAASFDPRAEVIADYRGTHGLPEFEATRADVVALLSRRPCSLEDIAEGLGMHRNEVLKYIGELDDEGLLVQRRVGRQLYYSAASGPSSIEVDDRDEGSGRH